MKPTDQLKMSNTMLSTKHRASDDELEVIWNEQTRGEERENATRIVVVIDIYEVWI